MPYPPEYILAAAQQIRPQLPELLGEQAPECDRQLAALLDQIRDGQPVHQQILELLAKPEATRTQLNEILSVTRSYSKGFNPLPGDPPPLPQPPMYECPYGDYSWERLSIADPIPPCPNHDCSLVLKGTTP